MTEPARVQVWTGWPLALLPADCQPDHRIQSPPEPGDDGPGLQIPDRDATFDAEFQDGDLEWGDDEAIESQTTENEAAKRDRGPVQERRLADQCLVLRRLAKVQPGMVAGTSAPSLDAPSARKLLEDVCSGLHAVRYREAYNFLVKGLYRGVRKLGWAIEVPAPIQELRNTASAFMPDVFRALPAFRELRRAILAAATDPTFYQPDNNPYLEMALKAKSGRAHRPWMDLRALHVSQILVSSIVFGATLHRSLVWAILDALPDGPRIHGDLMWLDLQVQLPPLGGRQQRRGAILASTKDPLDQPMASWLSRRWFPDPLTSLLILRYHACHPGPSPAPLRDADRLVSFYLACLSVRLERLPTLSALIQLAAQGHATELPASLVAYAGRPDSARSLPEHTWIRVRHGLVCPRQDSPDESPITASTEPAPRARTDYPDQEASMRAVRRTLAGLKGSSKQDRGSARKRLAELKKSGDLSPMLYCLACWCEHLAAPRNEGGRDVRASSLRTYFSRIGPRLVSKSIDFDLQEAREEDFLDLYTEVIEDAEQPKTRFQIGLRLADFHRYLVSHFNVPSVSMGLGAYNSASVDANFITEQEYLDASEALRRRAGTPPEIASMQEMILLLGYRLGLRRGETRYLRLKDIQILKSAGINREPEILAAELVLRSHTRRKLKTDNARRRLALHLLLPDEELKRFVSFAERRQKRHGISHDQLLFGQLKDAAEPLEEGDGFGPVTAALRAACGDPEIRFHSLRHSFASRNLLLFWSLNSPSVLTRKWLSLLGQDDSVPTNGAAQWQQLSGLQSGTPTRKALYVVSMALGHADPDSSLSSYVHVMDLILGAFLEAQAPQVTLAGQAVLLGSGVEALRVARSKIGIRGESLADALIIARKRSIMQFREPIPRSAAPRGPVELPPDETPRDVPGWPDMMLVFRAMAAFAAQDRQLAFAVRCQAAADVCGLDADQVSRWATGALAIYAINGPGGVSIHTRTPWSATKPGGKPEQTYRPYRWLLPAPPHAMLHRKESAAVYGNLMRGLQDPTVAPRLRAAITVFLYSGNAYSSGLHAVNAKAARAIAYLIRHAGIDSKRVTLEVLKTRFRKPALQVQIWREHLMLPDAVVKGCQKSAHPAVAVLDHKAADGTPICPTGVTFRIKPRRAVKFRDGAKDPPKYAIASFRFAVVLAAITSDLIAVRPLPTRDAPELSDALQSVTMRHSPRRARRHADRNFRNSLVSIAAE